LFTKRYGTKQTGQTNNPTSTYIHSILVLISVRVCAMRVCVDECDIRTQIHS